jgi:hypothetical protein
MKVGEKAFFNVWQVNRTGGDLIRGTLWPPGLPEQVQIQIQLIYFYKQD